MAKSTRTFPELTTKRLRLRRVEAHDTDGLHAFFGDPDAMRYWNFPARKTRAETERWGRILGKTTSPHANLAWAVVEKRSDRCIGMVNYHHREPRNRRLEIGYILTPAQQGRGLMTEALQALLAYCFGELGVHRVEAMINPDNAASIRLVERLGFRREGGPLRDYWRVGDLFMSALVYSLVDDEWVQARRKPTTRTIARR